jgi:hypothetical protein
MATTSKPDHPKDRRWWYLHIDLPRSMGDVLSVCIGKWYFDIGVKARLVYSEGWPWRHLGEQKPVITVKLYFRTHNMIQQWWTLCPLVRLDKRAPKWSHCRMCSEKLTVWEQYHADPLVDPTTEGDSCGLCTICRGIMSP